MTNKNVKILVIITAAIFLLSGGIMYAVFMKLGYDTKSTSHYIDLKVNNYIDTKEIELNKYNDVFSNINVSKIVLNNIDKELTSKFTEKQNNILSYIDSYYKEIKEKGGSNLNSVTSTIKTQINGTVLSIFYKLDFVLDKNIYDDNIKSYIVTLNIDLGSNRVLDNDKLLTKYNYSKEYIATKLFEDEVLIDKNEIVVDKKTYISLLKGDIEKRKEEYVDTIILNFDNIIEMYIENGSLALVYDSKDLMNLFFDNKFESKLNIKYLK